MAIAPNKRSVMALYSKAADAYCHRVRIVLAEKGVTVDILDVQRHQRSKEELQELNPYGSVPTLIDRDLVLYQSEIIMEYLDERFPHPPLMPVYPVARGRSRLMMYRIHRDWYRLMDKIFTLMGSEEVSTTNPSQTADAKQSPHTHTDRELKEIQKELKEGLVSIGPIFSDMPYFLSEEFSLVDCCMAPLLWRLPILGITLPKEAQAVISYSERLFEREAFLASLTEAEQSMRR